MVEKKYFSLPAAARELGVSTDVLRREYRNDLIPAIKTPGGQPRFTAETIEAIKQNGWPQTTSREHKLVGATSSVSDPSQVGVVDSQSSNAQEVSPDQEEPIFPALSNRKFPIYVELEQRGGHLDQFYRKWTDYACRLLPYWLTPDQRCAASRQIASEIEERTPQDESQMASLCSKTVRSVLQPLERQRDLNLARDAALHRVLAKIPADATDSERMRIQALARSSIQQAGEQVESETLFNAACQEIAPVLTSVELRRQRERLRAWALRKLPWQANEKEQREYRGRINAVFEQMNGEQDEVRVRDQLDEALEPILAAIPRRIDEERRHQRIPGLLSSAKLHVGTYLHTLYNGGELDYEAIVDWEWRQELESIVVSELQKQLSGGESNEQVRKSVERILDDELEEDDDENE